MSLGLFNIMNLEKHGEHNFHEGVDPIISIEVDLSLYDTNMNEVVTVIDGIGKCKIEMYGDDEGDNVPHIHLNSVDKINVDGRKRYFRACIRLDKAEFFDHGSKSDTFKMLGAKDCKKATKNFNRFMHTVDKKTHMEQYQNFKQGWINTHPKDIQGLEDVKDVNYEKLMFY